MKGSFRRLSRRKIAIVAGAVVALAVAVPTAWAVFDDVPPSSPHYNDVNAIQGAGISGGCAPNLYCPDQFVRRDQMASFIARGDSRSGLSSTTDVAIGDEEVELGNLTIAVGGVAGQTQFVKLDAMVQVYIEDEAGCPCETMLWIDHDELGDVSLTNYVLNADVAPSGFGAAAASLTAVVQVPTATTQTFRVIAVRNDGDDPSGDVRGYASMSAVTAPFGSTGTNILGAGTVSGERALGSGRR